MATPREHIEKIRREKFWIGREMNPVMEDLHQAVMNLSAELYAKDVHFLMELIQNAEDNEYPSEVQPSLEFIITSKDITATGAPSTLLIFNNEKGFFEKNIDSICSVGKSTKKGNRQQGYIGEKGIGFKSVFLITSQPCIFSNGYQIKFSENPHPECNVGYIVPEWVEAYPSRLDIEQIYGANKTLPATTIVLPLKSEKVAAVKDQLSSIHPEVLLFLTKIKRLTVREDNSNPKLNTVSAISISSETNYETRKNIDAVSYTLHLSAEEDCEGRERECSYYMWRQKFPVKPESRVGRRMEVEDWIITLALPSGERLNRGMNSPGMYAFLPTEMVTNFPFIIQADFVLSSSRETILLDDKWNKGILSCVPIAFVEAFTSLVTATEAAPVATLPHIFAFLPVKASSFPELNPLREVIKAAVVEKNILPCESYLQQKFFYKPKEVGRLMPAFWNILTKAGKQGVSLHNLSSHGNHILNSAFDNAECDEFLNFLGVGYVDKDWYTKWVKSSNLVMDVSEDVYLDLLCFFAENWSTCFKNTGVETIPILKYMGLDGKVSLWSINRATQYQERICLSSDTGAVSWLIDWNKEFNCVAERFFMPKKTQESLKSYAKRTTVKEWLRQLAIVEGISVVDYAALVVNNIKSNRKLVVAFTHFLYHSLMMHYLTETEVRHLCSSMVIIDCYGRVSSQWQCLLVPAKGSKWVGLLGSNPWAHKIYIELGEDYIRPEHFANVYTSGNKLKDFLKLYMEVSDIPDLCPPDATFHSVDSPLTSENTFLLLDWIRSLRVKGVRLPSKFLNCIKEGSWLKTSVGYKPPSQSFLPSSEWGILLQVGCELVDIPLIDQAFYSNKVRNYKEELKAIGVMFEFGEACQFIGEHLMSLADYSRLSRTNVLFMLKFIKFLREKYLSPEEFITSVKKGNWLKTSHGDRSPVGAVLFDSVWQAASHISSLPFIDGSYYGRDIIQYRSELQLLGVVVEFDVQIVAKNFKLPAPSSMTAESVRLMLECIRSANSSDQIVAKIKDERWLRTNLGYKSPAESFLFDTEWGCLLNVVGSIPSIDEKFYKNTIRSYKVELKKMGVAVDFAEASKAVALSFKQLVSSSSLTKENALSLLACFKHLKEKKHRPPTHLFECACEEKWIKTCLGYRSPKDCILFDTEWESISPVARLPFIDDSDSCYSKAIHNYKDELKDFKVVVEFKKGSRFVSSGLNIPHAPSQITSANVISLLKCIRNLLEEVPLLPKDFLEGVKKKWLKTYMGYRCPNESLLFDSSWTPFLQKEDGPFIDETFYGAQISSFKKELEAIGVTTDPRRGCSLIADHLSCHSQFTVITRIYSYLSKNDWVPEDGKVANWIWIPNGSEKGEWVSAEGSVLHDKDNIFGSQMNILDKHYEKDILGFFVGAFGVRGSPSMHDYCKLWSDWENKDRKLTFSECSSFWAYAAKNWTKKKEKLLTEGVAKLPVKMKSGDIQLVNKQDVFIPDDLQLKDLFECCASNQLFVWHPEPSIPSMPRSKLYEIYRDIGVSTISESVQKGKSSISDEVEFTMVNPREVQIGNGFFRIALGFLSDSSHEMSIEKKHQIVKQLCSVTIYQLLEPITVSYFLTLSSGKTITAEASRMIRWERENSSLFFQKVDRWSGHKTNVEFATYFAEVISEGLLWEFPERIAGLSELIRLGFLVDFEEDAVNFLLKNKNLQLFVEDEEFLTSALSSK